MAKKEKVTVIVLEEFQDKSMYPAGTELEVDKERADDLVSRKLAKVKEMKTPKDPKEPEKSKEVKTETAKTEAEKAEEGEKDDDKGTEK